jgi:NADH:ubiquinone oxidoreductase subunit K
VIELAFASGLVAIGVYGVLVRRDLIGVLAAMEVMMAGALLVLVTFGSIVPRSAGVAGPQIEAIGLLVLVVAAAEAAVGLALVVLLAQRKQTTSVDDLTEVKG